MWPHTHYCRWQSTTWHSCHGGHHSPIPEFSPERAPVSEFIPERASDPEFGPERVSVPDQCPVQAPAPDQSPVQAPAHELSLVSTLTSELCHDHALVHGLRPEFAPECSPESTPECSESAPECSPESAPECAHFTELNLEPSSPSSLLVLPSSNLSLLAPLSSPTYLESLKGPPSPPSSVPVPAPPELPPSPWPPEWPVPPWLPECLAPPWLPVWLRPPGSLNGRRLLGPRNGRRCPGGLLTCKHHPIHLSVSCHNSRTPTLLPLLDSFWREVAPSGRGRYCHKFTNVCLHACHSHLYALHFPESSPDNTCSQSTITITWFPITHTWNWLSPLSHPTSAHTSPSVTVWSRFKWSRYQRLTKHLYPYLVDQDLPHRPSSLSRNPLEIGKSTS